MSTPAQPASPTAEPSSQPVTPPAPEGTAPTPPEPAAPATPATPPTPAEPAAPAADPTAAEPKGKTPKFEGEFDPAKFERLVENLRGEVASEKSKRETAEQKAKDDQADFMKKLAGLFGVDIGQEKPPTPEELAQQLEQARGETQTSRDQARQTQVELAVYKTAGKHGGDPDALLDSRGFAQAVAKLDPTSASFDADVAKAVKDAVNANPKLAAVKPAEPTPPAVPAGGAPMDGAPGGKRQLGAEDAARMTPEQITKAVEEGRFTSYLGGGR